MGDERSESARGRGGERARRAARTAGRGSELALAATAHAAIGFGLFGIGFLASLAITAVIWLVAKRNGFVEEHADRAGRYQLFVLVTNVAIVALGGGLFVFLDFQGWWQRGGARTMALVLVLLGAAFVFAVWYVVSIGYGLYAALRVLAGDDFHYPAHPFRKRRRRGDALDRPLRWEE